jgi:hypothetical protein
MDDREPPSNGRYVATEPEEKWREKKDGYGDEIEKAMETRVQKIHELIIARARSGGVSATHEGEALFSPGYVQRKAPADLRAQSRCRVEQASGVALVTHG